MPSWLLPAVRLILPHVGNIIAAAKPVFTKRREAADQATVQQQIAELQQAATENAALIKELAEQLQTTVNALEQAATATQERVRRLYAISVTAMLVALAALLVAIVAITSP
jgi:hypothetical protein